MILKLLPITIHEAFLKGEVEVKVISVAEAEFEERLEAALLDGWIAVTVRSDNDHVQGLLVRSTENKTEE